MATTVGRVEIEVDADGSGLVRQLRVIGNKAGAAGGAEMGKSMSEAFNRTTTITEGGKITKVTESFRTLDKEFSKISGSSRDAAGGIDKTDKSLGNVLRKFARMHVVKQAAAWTTLFLGAMEGLAVLSSAAGGGLLILGGALAGVIGGLGIGIAAFSGLTQELDKMPESVRPAAEAFKALGDVFSELQDRLTVAAFEGTEGAWKSLGDTIVGLTPAMESVADIVGNLVVEFSNAVAPGTTLFESIDKAIRNTGPIFDRFVRTLGILGDALLDAFNNPQFQRAIQKMFDYTDRLFTRFDEFVNSEGFTEWIGNTERILGDLVGLLESTGTMLNNLVTPEAVERMSNLITNLSEAMPFLEELFEVFGELDAFGLIAQILNDVGNALKPILEVLAPIASIINDVLTLAIGNLAIAFGILEAILLPVRLAWEFFASLVEKFTEYLIPVQDAIQGVIDTIGATADEIFNAFAPAIDEITQSIIDMLPSPEEFERFLREELIPQIQAMGDWIIEHVVPAIEDFAHWMRDEAVPAMEAFWSFVTTYITPVLTAIKDGFDKLPGTMESFGRGVRTMVLIAMGPLGTLLATVLNVIDAFNTLAGKEASSGYNPKGGSSSNPRKFASGGSVFGPTRALIGESGPEAVVPLRRNLSQVDPSVRWLSAIAQGEMPRMASGGIVGGGRQVIFQSGAIVVQGVTNPEAAAVGVLNRAAERFS